MNPADELTLRDSAFTDAGEDGNPAGIVLDARYLNGFGVLNLRRIHPRLGSPQRGDQLIERTIQAAIQ